MSTRTLISDDGVTRVYSVSDGSTVIGQDSETIPTPTQINTAARTAKITGAKTRARQISVLAQTPAARTTTAWTQAQRVTILDAIGDLALMLSWLADDLLRVPEAPD